MEITKTVLLALFLFTNLTTKAQLGIGTTTPAPSAQLDVNSTSKGLLPPRMTFEQRNQILSPVAGLMIWCSNCGLSGELQIYNGTNWTNMVGGVASEDSVVRIGTQVWMLKNLDVIQYRNGDTIPQVLFTPTWSTLTTGAWCYYQNNANSGYGKLYNWYAVNDPRGLAPAGWHVPSDSEWTVLGNYLGGDPVAGDKMRVPGNTWINRTQGTNSSGFLALPDGYRDSGGDWFSGGNKAYWWTSSIFDTPSAWMRSISSDDSGLYRGNSSKNGGFSIRCVKD